MKRKRRKPELLSDKLRAKHHTYLLYESSKKRNRWQKELDYESNQD